MANPKKVSTKKAVSKKASTQKLKASAKKNPSRKRQRAKSEEILLNQQFDSTLAKLISYWEKQVKKITKQLQSQQGKLNKLLDKQKEGAVSSKKMAKINTMQEDINNLQASLTTASQSANKVNSLKKHIDQFESIWVQQSGQQMTDLLSKNKGSKKSKIKDKDQQKAVASLTEVLEQGWDEGQPAEEEMIEELEDIFMPQEDLSEFEVIEDYSVTQDDDLFEEEDN